MAGKTLIIAEKPSVGRDLAAAIPGQTFKRAADRNSLESERVIISWAVGHLLGLADPEDYNPDWKRWRAADLPMLPEKFKLKPIGKTRSQLTALRALAKRDDVSLIVNACDAGREGELIFRYVMDATKARKPMKRLWLASMTEQAIRDGLAAMKDAGDYDRLADAARCRSEADWLVGMNGSRAATLALRPALGGACSVGRVQTPTLAILVRRELEIRDFTAEDYWIVEAVFDPTAAPAGRAYPGSYRDGKRFDKPQDAQAIVDAVSGQEGEITKLERKEVKEKAPALYDLTTLQREASGAFGWTAAKTLEIAQKLYEQYKLLTYPRTDSRWLSSDMEPKLDGLLAAVGKIGPYATLAAAVRSRPLPLKQVIDDSKVTDHHAIIPTGKLPAADLPKDEKLLYDMVARRLLAALSDVCVVQRTRVETTVSGHVFISKGRIIVTPGWRAAYDGVKWVKSEEQVLPALEESEAVRTVQAEAVAKQTQPPKRYTDAGLLGVMETAGKLVEDDEAREAMKASGLGTPATRAATIERLISANYVAREKKALVPTEKGIALIQLLGDHQIASPSLTGEWERRLGLIERGDDTRGAFMSDLRSQSGGLVKDLLALGDTPLAAQMAADRPADQDDRPILAPCPLCKKPLRESPKAWSCWTPAAPGCGMTIWKQMFGRKIPKKVALELATIYRTSEPVKGLKSKAGKEFDAFLKMGRGPDGKPKVLLDFDGVPRD